MDEEYNKPSAHESIVELHEVITTLRASIASNTLKPIISRDGSGEVFLTLEWPDCPFFHRVMALCGPKDLDMYEHKNTPWIGHRPNKHCYENVELTKDQITQWNTLFSKGRVVCPVTLKNDIRLYEVVCDFMIQPFFIKLLFCSERYAFAISFSTINSFTWQLTDVVEIKRDCKESQAQQ